MFVYRYRVESSSETSESSDEEEYGEERDLFVAQLYKFQEERGSISSSNSFFQWYGSG